MTRKAHFMHENGATEASPASRALSAGQSTVLPHHNHHHRGALRSGPLQRNAKVEPVPGVVLDDHERAGRTADGTESGKDGGGRRGGKDSSGHRCSQHATAEKTSVGRLVTTASS